MHGLVGIELDLDELQVVAEDLVVDLVAHARGLRLSGGGPPDFAAAAGSLRRVAGSTASGAGTVSTPWQPGQRTFLPTMSSRTCRALPQVQEMVNDMVGSKGFQVDFVITIPRSAATRNDPV